MIRYATGDGLTDLESRHWQIVDLGAVRNGLGPDTRDWTTVPAYRERLERARRDIERGQRDSRIAELAALITDEQFDLWCSILHRGTA